MESEEEDDNEGDKIDFAVWLQDIQSQQEIDGSLAFNCVVTDMVVQAATFCCQAEVPRGTEAISGECELSVDEVAVIYNVIEECKLSEWRTS